MPHIRRGRLLFTRESCYLLKKPHAPPLVLWFPMSLLNLYITLERTCMNSASRYWRIQCHLFPVQSFVRGNFQREPGSTPPYASDFHDQGIPEPSLQLTTCSASHRCSGIPQSEGVITRKSREQCIK